MALELIGGAAVGAVFGELVRACMEVKDKAVMFRPTMNQLEDTLELLGPVIKDIELYNHQLNRPQSDIESLIGLMEKGKRLLCKCSRIRGWYDVRKVPYQAKLVKLDKSLQRFVTVNLPAQMWRDQKQILLLLIHGTDHRGQQDLTVGRTVSQIGHAKSERIKVVLKFDSFCCSRGSSKLLRVVAGVCGVDSVSIQRHCMTVVVVGSMDPVHLVGKFRKFRRTEILQVNLVVTDHNKAEEGNQLKSIMPSSSASDENSPRISEYDEIESNLEQLARPAADETSTANSARDQNSWRISEYDETNENTLSEGGNHGHIERLALPSPPADETSAGKHEKEYEEIETQLGPQIMQRLRILEGTAGKTRFLTPAIVLLCCFNLLMAFFILMYK